MITYEDSLTMPENKLEEIVHGEGRIMPPVTFFHACLVRRLSKILEARLNPRQYTLFGGDVGLGIERTPLTCRIPDLMVFETEILRRSRSRGAANDPYIWTAPNCSSSAFRPPTAKAPFKTCWQTTLASRSGKSGCSIPNRLNSRLTAMSQAR